ncbi:MAG: Gfo/Idh/MocA family oxidoreductase [Terrimesophilobacter sp.]
MTKVIPRPVRVGLVGCGNVSRQYLRNVLNSDELTVITCADINDANATAVASEFGLRKAKTVDELLNDPDVDLVLNLTLPTTHADVTLRALAAGKHVYTEKPLAATLENAKEIIEGARQRGLQVGSAPDTFLGVGQRACAELVQSGVIGRPVSVNAFMMNAGPERFHPNPDFLYRIGAGPLLDIGPYYLTTLVAMFGAISRVGGLSAMPRTERVVQVGERAGAHIEVDTPTHVAGLLLFANGVVCTLVTSFDVLGTRTPSMEIHGLEGSILAPPANSWAGPVLVKKNTDADFVEVAIPESEVEGFMGMGLIDMAASLRAGRIPAAMGARALHVLEVMAAILESGARGGAFTDIASPDQDLSLTQKSRGTA